MSGSLTGNPSGTSIIPVGAAGSAGSNPKMTSMQQRDMARNLIYSYAKPIFQRVASRTFTNVASGNNIWTVNPLQVGFLRRFVLTVTATISNTDATHAANLVGFGLDNLIANITFNDFTGNPRHNASGRSLRFVEAAKTKQVPGAAYTSDSVSGYGSTVASNVAPTISGGGSASVTGVWEIPIMVDLHKNMAGGLWLGTNNQSTTLNVTFNAAPIGLPTADPLNLMYRLAAGGTTISATPITSLTATLYQDYWNSVPVDKAQNPILPIEDLMTAYMINESNTGMTFAAGQRSAWNYPTFSKILGTYFVYDNNGALNPGTDVTDISLLLANYSPIKQYDPFTLDRLVRQQLNGSFPPGCYPIITRSHPLDIDQYPALQFTIVPSAATAAVGLITVEMLRKVAYMASAAGMGGT